MAEWLTAVRTFCGRTSFAVYHDRLPHWWNATESARAVTPLGTWRLPEALEGRRVDDLVGLWRDQYEYGLGVAPPAWLASRR